MLTALALAFAGKKDPPVLIGAEHLDQGTMALWLVVVCMVLFFLLRPELWKRLFLERIDPRGPALARILLGITVCWTFIDLAFVGEFLFTDQGLWMTDMARKNYGGNLKTLWDPEHGFEKWTDVFRIWQSKWTILHTRSDPPFVWSIYACLLLSGVLMTFGVWTRVTTVLTWFLANQIYNYSPIFYAGGDTVLRVMLFLGMFVSWGEAYSVDTWRRRRKAIMRGAAKYPQLRKIVAWPVRIMMLQLAIIYSATGLLKSGGTWWNGSALYYAANLDHFYRVPVPQFHTVMQYTLIYPATTILVHWWEMLFPLALVGVAIHAYRRDKAAGVWPAAPRWRRWLSWSLLIHIWLAAAWVAGLVALYYYKGKYIGLRDGLLTKEQAQWIAFGLVLGVPIVIGALVMLIRARLPRVSDFLIDWGLGKRSWLGMGFLFHLGIEILMNVGTFVQVMWATYPVWVRGSEIDGFWRYIQTRKAAAGEGGRRLSRVASATKSDAPGNGPGKSRAKGIKDQFFDRLTRVVEPGWAFVRHRVPRPAHEIHHAPDERSIRRASLLRAWDLSHRLTFVTDEAISGEDIRIVSPGSPNAAVGGAEAGRALIRLLPGLWVLWPISFVPGVPRLALKVLHEK